MAIDSFSSSSRSQWLKVVLEPMEARRSVRPEGVISRTRQ